MRFALLAFCMMTIAAPAALAQDGSVQIEPVPAISAPDPAEQRSDMLDRLFGQLHGLKEAASAAEIETKIWKLWMSNDSPTAEVLLQQATAAMEDNQSAVSLAILDKVTEAYPQFAEGWNKRATLYFRMNRLSDSLGDIDKVLAIEPRHFGALAGRGMILAEQKKYPEALAAFRDALAINPQMPEVQKAIKDIERTYRPI